MSSGARMWLGRRVAKEIAAIKALGPIFRTATAAERVQEPEKMPQLMA